MEPFYGGAPETRKPPGRRARRPEYGGHDDIAGLDGVKALA
jgi:hypothetical protein